MPDSIMTSPFAYRALGFVDNPFPSIEARTSSPFWMRVLTHAAANALLAAHVRGASSGRPVMIRQSSDIPDTYGRAALNQFLRTSASDPGLSMLALSTTLDVMRLGTIRGPLAEFGERVTAMNLPLTVGLYFADLLKNPDMSCPEAASLTEGQLEATAAAFASDPEAATERFLGHRESDPALTRDEEFDALHMTYLRRAHLDKSPDESEDRGQDSDELDDETAAEDTEPSAGLVDPDDAMRTYLLAIVRSDLSPVLARSLSKYREHGENMVAQELRVTKAPRKTLEAILRLMSHRWKTIVFIWDGFEVWRDLEQQTRMSVMAALNELRWIIGKYGVMTLSLVPGAASELDETFAAAEQVDLMFAGFGQLYGRDSAGWDGALVQSWIDSASIEVPSIVRVDAPELAPLVSASEGDMLRFALIAEVAFRDAASRGATSLDGAAVDAALQSVRVEEDAG